jgi:hypothetical protein
MDLRTNLAIDEPGGAAGDERPLEHLIGWAYGPPGSAVREDALPASLRTALADARAEHPGRSLTCLAYRTLIDGVETARLGASEAEVPASQLVALSVVSSSATIDAISVVAHSLVLQIREG